MNPEVRLHLHPLLSVLGKLQTQLPPPSSTERAAPHLGNGLEERVLKATCGAGREGLGVSKVAKCIP